MDYKKIISSLWVYALLPLTAISITACSEHREIEDDCIVEAGQSELKINMTVETSLFNHKDVEVSDTMTRAESDKQLRYYVSAYRVYNGQLAHEYAQFSSSNPNLSVKLPLGKYRILAWSQFVDKNDSTSKGYFYTDDFKDMLLRNKYSYQGCDSYKMGCYATGDITVSYKTPELNLNLKPAMGQYRIKATDTADYKVGKVTVTYVDRLPCSLDVVNNRMFDYWTGIAYNNETPTLDCVAFDNVLAVTEEKIAVMVEVYDTDGRLRARRRKIEFPVVQGGITNVSAKIFTLLEPTDGYVGDEGGGVNDAFDNTIFIGIEK